MNKVKPMTIKPIPLTLVIALGVMLSGCAAFGGLTGRSDIATPTPTALAAVPASPATEQADSDRAGATVEAVEGRVFVKPVGEAEFYEVTTGHVLRAGDMIRTGAAGIARIKYAEDTETTMFENSQVVLTEFKLAEAAPTTIHLQVHIGTVFSRVNFARQPSSFLVETPASSAYVHGTAFYTSVLFDLAANRSPEELAALIESTAFFTQPIGPDNPVPQSLGDVQVAYDLANGVINVIYDAGDGTTLSVTLAPNETFSVQWAVIPNPTYQALLNRAVLLTVARDLLDQGDTDGALAVLQGLEPERIFAPEDLDGVIQELEIDTQIAIGDEPETIEAITNLGTTERGCGDSICDEYLGEPDSCAADCP